MMSHPSIPDVALFSPPSRMINHYRAPLALLYLGGYLTRRGYSVKVIDEPLPEQVRDSSFWEHRDEIIERTFRKMLDQFRCAPAKVVGISCYTTEYDEVVRLAEAVKAVTPHVPVVVGGIHPTFHPEDFEDVPAVDHCVLGEGEVTFFELCEVLTGRKKGDVSAIHGTASRDPLTRRLVKAAPRAVANSLDDISFPDYSLIDTAYYTTANPYAIRGCFLRTMYLLSSRGCPSQCTFCVASRLRQYFGSGRVRSAGSLIEELRFLRDRYAIDGFYFIDDLFAIDRNNVLDFCSRLNKERFGLLWGCSSKVSILKEDVIEAMAKAGCVQIDLGIERGSDQALAAVKKGTNLESIRRIMSACRRHGVRTFANMLVNVPGETPQDLDDIESLLKETRPDIVSINTFTPYLGTEIYDQSRLSLKREEYKLLSRSPDILMKEDPKRFRFAVHSVDLGAWARRCNRVYNRLWPHIKFHLSFRYLSTWALSRRKADYFRQCGLVLRELMLQKFFPVTRS